MERPGGPLGGVAPSEEEKEGLGELGKVGALRLLRETSPLPSWCLFSILSHPPGLCHV